MANNYTNRCVVCLCYAVLIFWSNVLCIQVNENGLADFSDEDEAIETIDVIGMGIKAVNTSSMKHFTNVHTLLIGINELTAFPDLNPISNTLETLKIRINKEMTGAGNVELAVLKQLRIFEFSSTGLTMLTSTCPDDRQREYKIGANDDLYLCNCQMVWLKVSSYHQL